MDKEMLGAQDYQYALDSQTACNLSGIVHQFSRIMDKIWNEANKNGHGTDWVNQHPISRLFAEQIFFLASKKDYSEACLAVETWLKAESTKPCEKINKCDFVLDRSKCLSGQPCGRKSI
jgi:hypothetical protein